jgi:hypothetical protein
MTLPAPRILLSQRIRDCREHNVIDQTGLTGEVAIYTLSDPRDVTLVRYVGQTRNPRARFAQHINTARLWLPDELPWWIKREELRPLYEWIRALYGDGGRLPMMFVAGWTSAELARSDERRFVRTFVAEGLPLLNQEASIVRRRMHHR